MPLYIRDEAVAELAREAKAATGAKTVTEAVKKALQNEIANANRRNGLTLEQKIADVMARADAMGPSNHSVDMKQFMDELSGE